MEQKKEEEVGASMGWIHLREGLTKGGTRGGDDTEKQKLRKRH